MKHWSNNILEMMQTYLTNIRIPVGSRALWIAFQDATMLYFCLAVIGILGSAFGTPPAAALAPAGVDPLPVPDSPPPPSDSLLPVQPILRVTEFNSLNPPIHMYMIPFKCVDVFFPPLHFLSDCHPLALSRPQLKNGEKYVYVWSLWRSWMSSRLEKGRRRRESSEQVSLLLFSTSKSKSIYLNTTE